MATAAKIEAAGSQIVSRGRERWTLRRTATVLVGLAAALVLGIFLAALIGNQRLPAGGTICALSTWGSCGLTPEQVDILWTIRLPRIFLGVTVGASLATAGAAYQALLRNPLAEPYLLGVSNGAAVGTMVGLIFFAQFAWSRPLFAFAGALTATLVVYRIARGRAGASPERMILSGVIVTTFLSSAIVFITALMDATRIRAFTFWLLGDLSGGSAETTILAAVVAVVGCALLAFHARPLNLLMLGERDAFDLGVEVGRVRLSVFVVASMLVGASVASSGSVGYVGLVVPHLVRLLFGSDNRLVVPASALAGALFVIAADTVARTIISPRELPVGAITALIGAPLFIFLLRRG
jgi:iron complex transport system permease protein